MKTPSLLLMLSFLHNSIQKLAKQSSTQTLSSMIPKEKDKDSRPIFDSDATHSVTPYVHNLINRRTANFGQLRGVTGTTSISQSGTLTNITGGIIKYVLHVPTAVRTLISVKSILKKFSGYIYTP